MNVVYKKKATKDPGWHRWFKLFYARSGLCHFDCTQTDFLVTDKSIPHAIVKYAEDHDIDLTVVGTRGRSGLMRMVLGGVASSVVIYSSCPVLTIR